MAWFLYDGNTSHSWVDLEANLHYFQVKDVSKITKKIINKNLERILERMHICVYHFKVEYKKRVQIQKNCNQFVIFPIYR